MHAWCKENPDAEIQFETLHIKHFDEDMQPNVVFFATGGSMTLENFGPNDGDFVKGNFSVNMLGQQYVCKDAECTEAEIKELTGTISGTFAFTYK